MPSVQSFVSGSQIGPDHIRSCRDSVERTHVLGVLDERQPDEVRGDVRDDVRPNPMYEQHGVLKVNK